MIFDPFEFRSQGNEWNQIEQLEAVVEFFANFRPPFPRPLPPDTFGDPWAMNAKPLDDSDPDYIKVNLGLVEGTAAEVTPAPGGATIKLDGEPDLSDVIINPPNINNANNNPIVGPPVAANYPQRRRYLYDTLWLMEDTRRPSKLYRIMDVDDNAKTVTLDDAPNLGGKKKSKWKLNRRPIVVIIDPLGPRRNDGPPANVWSGATATVVGPDPNNPGWTILQLNGAQPLASVNSRFDTIYLADDDVDAHKPARTYRIMAVAAAPTRRITVEGTPNLPQNGSRWHIPAGVSGAHGPLSYTLGPPANPAARAARGSDHYDGAFFIVYDGQVMHRFRWTSYSSRDWGPWNVNPPEDWRNYLSSLRGNGRYYYSTYRSGNAFRNYSFAVIGAQRFPGVQLLRPLPRHRIVNDSDPVPPPARPGDPPRPWDTARFARYHAGTPVPPAPAPPGAPPGAFVQPRVMADANGKRLIRLHMGRGGVGMAGVGTGSAGCIVSPLFSEMRTALIQIFNQEYRAFYGPGAADADVQPLNGVAHAAAAAIWNANGVTQQGWDDKLVGHLWLIRPDEPPLS